MLIQGACHCGNIQLRLDWPGEPAEIPARACTCSFCVKHGGVWTSHPDAALSVRIADKTAVSPYSFGTRTAQFYVCTRCGVTPFVSSTVAGQLYAVVSVNALDKVAHAPALAADFDGESEADRLARRARNWIARVEIVD